MAVFLVGETYWYHGKLSPCHIIMCHVAVMTWLRLEDLRIHLSNLCHIFSELDEKLV